jgi:ABC-type antimicrobial peptide transport system permease subunit
MAVGATRARIAGVVLRRGAGPAVVGVVAGLLGSAFAARAMRALLYETSPVDPLILAAVGVGVLLIALLASVAPALRATRIDPVTCLKSD